MKSKKNKKGEGVKKRKKIKKTVKIKSPKEILMVTRPVCLPWDEASKNFAWEISKRLNKKRLKFHLLTCDFLPFTYKNIIEHPIYTSPDLQLQFNQKLRLLKFLLKLPKDVNILHFLFTPSKNTTKIVKKLVLPKAGFLKSSKAQSPKTIQTVATLNFEEINRDNVGDFLFADKVITHSKLSKNFLEKLGMDNIEHIYPGIDIKKFKYQPKSIKLLKKLGISYRDKVLLYTGEYVRLKATDLIVKAFQIISQKRNDIKIIFACRIKSKEDLEKKEQIEERFKKLGLSSKVIYLETFSNMEKLYNLANVFLFPVKEMTGKFDIALTILEAMACRVPTIISDAGALEEVVKIKNSAIVLKEKTASNLAKNIISILKDDKYKKKLGDNARKNVEKHFDINICAKKYEEIYNKL